jgi:hypothetical protein
MRYASVASLTVDSISVIPGRHHTSAVADVCIIGPISGKPEIGCGEPGIHNLGPVVVGSGPLAEPAIEPAQRVRPLAGPMTGSGQARWFGPRNDSREC